jgi:hypothetical protein
VTMRVIIILTMTSFDDNRGNNDIFLFFIKFFFSRVRILLRIRGYIKFASGTGSNLLTGGALHRCVNW